MPSLIISFYIFLQDPILSGMPYVGLGVCMFLSGIWADKLIGRAFLPVALIRKTMQAVGVYKLPSGKHLNGNIYS